MKYSVVVINEFQHKEFAVPDEKDELVKNASQETTSVYDCGRAAYCENAIKILCG